MIVDFFLCIFDVVRYVSDFKDWFFVFGWCNDVGVCLLLDLFNCGFFWVYNKINNFIRYVNVDSSLFWGCWVWWFRCK